MALVAFNQLRIGTRLALAARNGPYFCFHIVVLVALNAYSLCIHCVLCILVILAWARSGGRPWFYNVFISAGELELHFYMNVHTSGDVCSSK